MERFNDLALVLKTFPYSERDRVAVLFTENYGKVTAMAKGAIHSRRYGGALGLLAATHVSYVQKPSSEMARLEEAVIKHEFRQIPADFERLAAASFMGEFCMKILEPHAPARDLFLVLINALHRLDEGVATMLIVNGFCCKALYVLGYTPRLDSCTRCQTPAREILTKMNAPEEAFFWDEKSGGMVCAFCASSEKSHRTAISPELLILFYRLTKTPFKDLAWSANEPHTDLFQILTSYLHHHIAALQAGQGLKSLQVFQALRADPVTKYLFGARIGEQV